MGFTVQDTRKAFGAPGYMGVGQRRPATAARTAAQSAASTSTGRPSWWSDRDFAAGRPAPVVPGGAPLPAVDLAAIDADTPVPMRAAARRAATPTCFERGTTITVESNPNIAKTRMTVFAADSAAAPAMPATFAYKCRALLALVDEAAIYNWRLSEHTLLVASSDDLHPSALPAACKAAAAKPAADPLSLSDTAAACSSTDDDDILTDSMFAKRQSSSKSAVREAVLRARLWADAAARWQQVRGDVIEVLQQHAHHQNALAQLPAASWQAESIRQALPRSAPETIHSALSAMQIFERAFLPGAFPSDAERDGTQLVPASPTLLETSPALAGIVAARTRQRLAAMQRGDAAATVAARGAASRSTEGSIGPLTAAARSVLGRPTGSSLSMSDPDTSAAALSDDGSGSLEDEDMLTPCCGDATDLYVPLAQATHPYSPLVAVPAVRGVIYAPVSPLVRPSVHDALSPVFARDRQLALAERRAAAFDVAMRAPGFATLLV